MCVCVCVCVLHRMAMARLPCTWLQSVAAIAVSRHSSQRTLTSESKTLMAGNWPCLTQSLAPVTANSLHSILHFAHIITYCTYFTLLYTLPPPSLALSLSLSLSLPPLSLSSFVSLHRTPLHLATSHPSSKVHLVHMYVCVYYSILFVA